MQVQLLVYLDLHDSLTPDSPAAINQGARYRLSSVTGHIGDQVASGPYLAYVVDGGEQSC